MVIRVHKKEKEYKKLPKKVVSKLLLTKKDIKIING